MRKLTEEGVTFKSPINSSKVFLSPEISMQVQRDLGSDIVMCFDECTPYPATEKEAKESMELSMRWAKDQKKLMVIIHRHYLGLFKVVCMNTYVMSRWQS